MGSERGMLIDGKAIANTVQQEIAQDVTYLLNNYGRVPGLAVIIVGDRKDSHTYVRMKQKACREVGMKSILVKLPADATEDTILDNVMELNADPEMHGILVQLPLPKHVNEEKILNAISIEKDVDGFHPLNVGRLCMKGREPLFVPCTPKGCIELLLRTGIPIAGKRAVVLGRSNIVGLPVAMLLNKLDATVSIVHSNTADPKSIVKEADIVIAAAGQARMIKGDWIKSGAAVIDVGINYVDDPTQKSGQRLVGDVDFEEVRKVAGWITPVPGGVGPMTIVMLLKNAVEGAKQAFACPQEDADTQEELLMRAMNIQMSSEAVVEFPSMEADDDIILSEVLPNCLNRKLAPHATDIHVLIFMIRYAKCEQQA